MGQRDIHYYVSVSPLHRDPGQCRTLAVEHILAPTSTPEPEGSPSQADVIIFKSSFPQTNVILFLPTKRDCCPLGPPYHDRLFIVDGSSSINKSIQLFSWEGWHLPPVSLIGWHHVNMCQQHVRHQLRIGAWHGEQVAVIPHHLMHNQIGWEDCWEDWKRQIVKKSTYSGRQIPSNKKKYQMVVNF